MPIPDATAERLREALSEFDGTLRDTAEWRDWETNDAYRHAILAGERRYPPKKIISIATGISVREFSGGPEANGYLRARGFQITPLRPGILQRSFEKVLAEYPASRATHPFNAQAEMSRAFQDIEGRMRALEEVQHFARIHVEASVGRGNWAKVPWIALMDQRETNSTTHGVYVVFLFRQDGSTVPRFPSHVLTR